MPYTNAWADNIPLGTVPANTIDEQIRQLRLDIHERMDQIVVDWTADPVVPLAAVGSASYAASYLDTAAIGSKAGNYEAIVAVLSVRFTGIALAKNVTINLNEVNTFTGTTNWDLANLYAPDMGTGINVPLAFVGRLSGDEALALRRLVIDIPSNTIQLIIDSVDGMSDLPQIVDLMIQLPFTVAP